MRPLGWTRMSSAVKCVVFGMTAYRVVPFQGSTRWYHQRIGGFPTAPSAARPASCPMPLSGVAHQQLVVAKPLIFRQIWRFRHHHIAVH